MDFPPSDPRNQTFFILGHSNTTDSTTPLALIPISLPTIDEQRIRLANTSINYGVQLGLCLFSLLATLLLLPPHKLRRPVHLAQASCLLVSVARLALLVLYFPGPLTEYYVAWTRDASVLGPEAYEKPAASSALGVVQLTLVEAALALQSSVLVRTWGAHCSSGSGGGSDIVGTDTAALATSGLTRGKCWWRPPVIILAVLLAMAAVGLRAVWAAHYLQALRGHTLPVPLDSVGAASTIVGAASVFYFCGIFFAHLALHLAATRHVLRNKRRKGERKLSIALTLGGGREGGLTSLEILAVGNGILMLAPCLFAGLDVAAGPGNTRVLPFDAGSWVQTLVAAGLPLISIAAFYRGSDSTGSRVHSQFGQVDQLPIPEARLRGRRRSSCREEKRRRASSLFFIPGETTISFSSSFQNRSPDLPSKTEEAGDITTLVGSNISSGSGGSGGSGHLAGSSITTHVGPSKGMKAASPTSNEDLYDLKPGNDKIRGRRF